MARVLVGAVAYTANVVPIWEGIRDYFRGSAVEMDFVLFSNYEQLVDALMAGWIDIAWNTNLAYARTYGLTDGTCVALAMRDTDATFRSVLVKRTGSELESMADLVGQRIALGSKDSGQARILPVKFLADAGITSENSTFVIFDSDVGKHGDTGRSELDALRAVLDDEADVAALGITTWQQLQASGDLGVTEFWTSDEYSHCTFTALPSLDETVRDAWVDHLMAMDWENPDHRPILEMEGLTKWVAPVLSGYDSLFEAVREQSVPLRW
ncbi:MAG: PhnD/SsuA/transferrin family substrate-binding protein [Actinomycetota bacterium]|nr:PhnD/SsuA/transferrin family substrate-binding protein [Actinomycetota bacterium]